MCEWPLRFWWHGPHSLDGPVYRRSADAEEFGWLGLGVGAEIVQSSRCLAWFGFSFGCLPRSRDSLLDGAIQAGCGVVDLGLED